MVMDWISVQLQQVANIVGGSIPRKKNRRFWNGRSTWVAPKNSSFPKSVIDNRFLTYAVEYYTPNIIALSGSTPSKEVSKNSLKNFAIPLPSISEQQRIVEILDRVDSLQQKRMRTDSIADMVAFALFLKMFGNPMTNPMNWEKKPFDRLVEMRSGLSVQRSQLDTREIGLPIVQGINLLQNGTLDCSDMRYCIVDRRQKKRITLQRGDLLFNWQNGYPHHVGKTVLWECDEPTLFDSSLIRIRCTPNQINPYYLWCLLNFMRSQKIFMSNARTQIYHQFHISELKRLHIIIPSLGKQQFFEEKLVAFQKTWKKQKKSRELIETMFSLFLHHAFSGELTARWREEHKSQLLEEMEEQAHFLSNQNGNHC